ncbi:MAG: hypothetical protein FJX77_02855 [Armatimonadetes bacterium]|nr:hypothetical protein [Armatimonadota bacterium]
MSSTWNKDTIAAEIVRIHQASEPLSYGEMQKKHLRLLRAAIRHFGSWRDAVEFAGLEYDQIRRYQVWTHDRIIERIQQHHTAGADLSWRHVSTVLDPPLAAAAIRPNRFESWQAALQAAGLDYDEIRRHRSWDSNGVIREIQQRHAGGESLRVSDVAQADPALVAAARRNFDTWYDAVVAAGIDEMEARRGLNAEYDDAMIRGEVSWAETRGKEKKAPAAA